MTAIKINRRHTTKIAALLDSAIRISLLDSADTTPTNTTEVMSRISDGWAREVILFDDENGCRLWVRRYSTGGYYAILRERDAVTPSADDDDAEVCRIMEAQ